MADVVMPQMGESIAEGTIVRWIKKVGDRVDRDEPLFEISTDKVDAEIPSPTAGVLLEIRAKEGETVPVNSVVAVIGDAGAAVGGAAPAAAPVPPTRRPPRRLRRPAPAAARSRPPRAAAAPQAPAAAESGRRRAAAEVVAAGAEDRPGAQRRHRARSRAPASAAG